MPKITKPPGTLLCPVPTVMVGCAAPGRRSNIITLAWAGTVCSNPPMVGLGIRPTRYSYELIKATGEFTVNLPNQRLLLATDFCGVVSGREVDKFAALGLTAVTGHAVRAPMIAECPVNLEVSVKQTIPLGSHDLFLGEILAVHLDQEILDQHGRIDPQKFGTFAYGPGAYWEVGRTLATYGFSNGEAGKV
ncbi:MAG: flavin reductase family protein [Bacteroidota bacterium]